MKILVLTGAYPHPGHPFSGVFNEKCVAALKELGNVVEVLSPRPYVPPFLTFGARWQTYAAIKKYEVRNGVSIHRPATPVIPRIGSILWVGLVAFLWCRHLARNMYRRTRFDALLSFDLVETGGLAWRIGHDLGIPTCGWAFGNDVRFPPSSPFGRLVRRAIERLDVVFYQSQELLKEAAKLLGTSEERMLGSRHVVLPHGIPEPPPLPRAEIRRKVRSVWGVRDDPILVLSIGRVVREKGIFELLEAISLAAARNSRIICVMVGSKPGFDEASAMERRLRETRDLRKRVKLLPACKPSQVWEYLCAADVFAFPSHKEGISNILLEAMVMGIPAVAFAIPSVLEIEGETGGLLTVPPFDSALFSEAILRLAAQPDDRIKIGERGRNRVLDRFMVRKNMAEAVRQLSQLPVLLDDQGTGG